MYTALASVAELKVAQLVYHIKEYLLNNVLVRLVES